MADDRPEPKLNLRYAETIAELDAIEPLWNALQAHHTAILRFAVYYGKSPGSFPK